MSDSFYSSNSKMAPGYNIINTSGNINLSYPLKGYNYCIAANSGDVDVKLPSLSVSNSYPQGKSVIIENAQTQYNLNIKDNSDSLITVIVPGQRVEFYPNNAGGWSNWKENLAGVFGRLSMTFSGPFSSPQTRNIVYRVQNNIVQLGFPDIIANTGSISIIAGSPVLPSFLRPSATQYLIYTARTIVTLVTVEQPSQVQIYPSGDINFFPNFTGTGFPIGTGLGIRTCVLSYSLY